MNVPFLARHAPPPPRCLGVLLCYNDADVLADNIEYLLTNRHEIIAWDHGSDDGTAQVLDRYNDSLLERKFLPRDFDFYRLYETMSVHLLRNYVPKYDWISWPDQDEFLEGPDRSRSYYEWIAEVCRSPYSYVQFNNFNFWFTEKDDPSVASPTARIRHYSLFGDCHPRLRAWKAGATNIRHFNSNPPRGEKYPTNFNLRHYPMRSRAQMLRRLNKDRADIQRGAVNIHYNNMKTQEERLLLRPEQLHYDDGKAELNHAVIFNWRELYGDVR